MSMLSFPGDFKNICLCRCVCTDMYMYTCYEPFFVLPVDPAAQKAFDQDMKRLEHMVSIECAFKYLYACVYERVYARIHAQYVYIYIYIYIYIHIYTCVCVCVFVHAFMLYTYACALAG